MNSQAGSKVTRSVQPGDLVKPASYLFDPLPVGLVISVQVTTVCPGPTPDVTVQFCYPTVLWPPEAVGKHGYGGPLKRIHEHHASELNRVG